MRCYEEAGLTYPMLEMVCLERVGETDLLRVRTEFLNECIVFDREIRPRRNIVRLTVPSLNSLDLIPLFTFVPRKQIFSRSFDILYFQLIFPQVGWCNYCNVIRVAPASCKHVRGSFQEKTDFPITA